MGRQEGMLSCRVVVCSKTHPIPRQHPGAKGRPFPQEKKKQTAWLLIEIYWFRWAPLCPLPSPPEHEAVPHQWHKWQLGPQREVLGLLL